MIILSNMVVKLISSHFGKNLTLNINQSLYTGTFPDSMKISKVVPIFKKDDILDEQLSAYLCITCSFKSL